MWKARKVRAYGLSLRKAWFVWWLLSACGGPWAASVCIDKEPTNDSVLQCMKMAPDLVKFGCTDNTWSVAYDDAALKRHHAEAMIFYVPRVLVFSESKRIPCDAVWHEVGHALGFGHVDHTIMSTNTYYGQYVGAAGAVSLRTMLREAGILPSN